MPLSYSLCSYLSGYSMLFIWLLSYHILAKTQGIASRRGESAGLSQRRQLSAMHSPMIVSPIAFNLDDIYDIL